MKLERDSLQTENDELKTANGSLRKVNDKYRENEQYMQNKYEEIRHRSSEKDIVIRQKDEIIFGLSRDNEALKADIRNLESVEEALKQEIDDLVQKRKNLEDINQSLKDQVCEQNIEMRKLDSMCNTLGRENSSLMKNIELFRKNTEQLLQENNQLKDMVENLESDNTDLGMTLNQLKSDNEMQRQEIQRLRRSRTASREAEFRRELPHEVTHESPVRDRDIKSFRPNNEEPNRALNTPPRTFTNNATQNIYEEYLKRMQPNLSNQPRNVPSSPYNNDKRKASQNENPEYYSENRAQNRSLNRWQDMYDKLENDANHNSGHKAFDYSTPVKKRDSGTADNFRSKLIILSRFSWT